MKTEVEKMLFSPLIFLIERKNVDSERNRGKFCFKNFVDLNGTVAQSQHGLLLKKFFGSKLISVLMLNRLSFVFAVRVEASIHT